MKLILILFFTISSTFATLTPPNRWRIPMIYNTGITQAEFLTSIKEINQAYENDLYRKFGSELIIFHSWASPAVNAFADQKDKKFMITIYGGVARFPGMTKDAFSLVLCHELGHHLGAEPRKVTNKWSSVEGQADYFATMKCLRKLWEKDDNLKIIKDWNIPELVRLPCVKSFKAKNDQALCIRSSYAGLVTSHFLLRLEEGKVLPDFDTPEQDWAEETLITWPTPQCRLDTYFHGSICPVSKDISFDTYSEKIGACHKELKLPWGSRPRCWYNPY